ncbi:winged helix-turn-helix transcriptional regulator [Enterococcus mundtii]|uniref:winged helix-turn-helix transcriptional regulator n=1 Tax=Enterococcus mundtii TaxID=53346 RepID=UPI000D3377AC|nr:winged helix-turn-helix transcriptional regulator [Enterococcus mundtii]PTO42206.1 DNA-binding protein [Enterococcus mundtii]
MTNNYKTIKELADELGVSKQTIHYHVKSLSNIKRDKNNKGAVLLNKEEQNFIYAKVGGTKSSTIKDDTIKDDTIKDDTIKDDTIKDDTIKDDTIKDDTIKDSTIKDSTIKDDTNYFLSEIQFLRIQLENKDDQIVKMQSLLDQQQRLALQDKKILEEYKQENDRLKALKSPSEEFREPVDSRQKDDQNKKEASIETAKKWWQIWKT